MYRSTLDTQTPDLAHQDVIERLLDEESAALGELEVQLGKPIRLQTDALYVLDQYDVVLM